MSGVAAAGGLFFTAWQMVRSRRVADLQALQKFFDGLSEREAALAQARDDAAAQTHAFNEFLNFLEVYASAHNRKLVGSGSEEMVRHKLEDSYIELAEAKDWHPLIERALDRSTTFGEIVEFIRRHRKEIAQRRAERSRRVAGL